MAKHFTIPAAIQTTVTPARALKVFTRDAFTCVYCGAMGVALNADHLRPQAHYAATVPAATVNAYTNLVTACATCNNAKGMQDLAGFARMLLARGMAPATVAAMKLRARAAARRKVP